MDAMATRVNKGKFKMGDYNLSAHPEHAMALGSIVAGWACVEGQLAWIAALLMQGPAWQTYAAFYQVPTNHTRLNIIKALTERMAGKKEFRLRLLQLVRDTEKLAEKRNTYVHSRWVWGTNPAETYLEQNVGTPQVQNQKIQATDMQLLIAEIMDLSTNLRQFANDYVAVHPLELRFLMEELPAALQEILPAPPEGHEDDSDPQNQHSR